MHDEYCTNCLRHGRFTKSEVKPGHHITKDRDRTTPSCQRCHVEITAVNTDASRSLGFKELTTEQRQIIWNDFFTNGSMVFVREPSDLSKCLDINPSSVLRALTWLGQLHRAQESLNIEFPHKGIMTYTNEKGIRVLHLHSSAADEDDS